MKYADIRSFHQRCEDHPDHQEGMVSHADIKARLFEEVEELRMYIEAGGRLPEPSDVWLTEEEKKALFKGCPAMALPTKVWLEQLKKATHAAAKEVYNSTDAADCELKNDLYDEARAKYFDALKISRQKEKS